ncbi:hypothetical protein [Pseudoalteromonas luteoviolacea]|uniref:Uncharacterized protein n=1 Tax=Pseudoalteromonas luteoviolacea (strain 2ta16) TaxID=1353533 RepID=V4H2T1_PSEL2|nr:hypothetical protein [Pseudoalteromonas luteoviolacea]ESP91771.1 hypothetical protein PL2TA16_05412 [Pseudoalteromonas luteoviolacea 2ta16]KZN40750.1 hypothetical protein N483_16610 [Pseudoalteromonas luteoviolacea NCIMB 1944]
MSLISNVQQTLNRLSHFGWNEWFQEHGLDISAEDLTAELQRLLPAIRRDKPGMEDFSTNGKRAIEAGKPSLSLLYHALSSPNVHPTSDGKPHQDSAAYPTLTELDQVENLIFSLSKRTLSSFQNPVVAVFAYQYRVAQNSPHKLHADIGYSRCGIARIGTEPERYDAPTRSFTSSPESEERSIAVLPARYGAFIAERRSPDSQDVVFRDSPTDHSQEFLFPVHKLFAGDECLFDDQGQGIHLSQVEFTEYHINEKLRRLHKNPGDNPDFVPPLAIFDLDKPPFTRDSVNDELVEMKQAGDSVLVISKPQAHLSRTASQQVNGNMELARFEVPEGRSCFFSSLIITAHAGRAAPEYVNIRHKVITNNNGDIELEDLNKTLNTREFTEQVINLEGRSVGGYEAAHFIDDSCDGYLSVSIPELSNLQTYKAFSLVTAVDFFPQIRQLDIQRWVEELYGAEVGLSLDTVQNRLHFSQGGPRPLSDGRFTRTLSGQTTKNNTVPNQSLTIPNSADLVFPAADRVNRTMTSIVGPAASGSAFNKNESLARALSWLPDSAADVFAPGWDISTHVDQGQNTYASYGLGSPFLEDAKLCAALNSYWPAAAPDSSRTFNISWSPTAQPLLDKELGYHPAHPRVLSQEVSANLGWDGEHGPFIESENGQNYVNCAHRNRSDYVSNALANKIGFNGLDKVPAEEMIQRMDVLRACFDSLRRQTVTNNQLWMVNAEKVPSWQNWHSTVLPKASNSLEGIGYIYRFAIVGQNAVDVEATPITRERYELVNQVEFQISAREIYIKVFDQDWVSQPVNLVLEEY